MYADNDNEGPKGTFEIYKAEADSLYKQGEHRKAIISYTQALELSPNDRKCLVARSKCHLRLGDLVNALKDAETSLEEDKLYHKGMYQKAEALYYQGEFETALIFYHRGNKLRPELQEFRLGIQKTEEAINNSVGSPGIVHLTTEGDLSYFEQILDDKKVKKGKVNAAGRPLLQTQKVAIAAGSERTIRQLLGELYGDRRFLEKLLKETDSSTEMGKTIMLLIQEGLSYLDTRSDFWRQHKPIYARARQYRGIPRQNMPEIVPSTLLPNDYILRELEKIDVAQCEGKYERALKRAQRCLATVQQFSEIDVLNKMEVIANLHSCIGNSYYELGQYDKAFEEHKKDLKLSELRKIQDAISRALDNLGRVHAKRGEYAEAIAVWERKIPMIKSALESTWLFHEIGHCYLELNLHTEAKWYGEQSVEAAVEAQDKMWQLQASVLIAQAEVKLGQLAEAAGTFDKALHLAEGKGDKTAAAAIEKAIEDINAHIIALNATILHNEAYAKSVKLDIAENETEKKDESK